MLKVARLIRRNRRKHWKVILDQTKEVLFSEKHKETPVSLKESPVTKFRIQPDCQFSVVSVFSNWLHSSERIPENAENF